MAATVPAHRGPASVIPLTSRAEWTARLATANPRRMSPWQMAQLSVRLRETGRLGVEESRMLACHADLHPEYAATLGAIGGPPASPYAARDLLAEWEARRAFALTHTPEDRTRIERIGRIIDVLRSLAES